MSSFTKGKNRRLLSASFISFVLFFSAGYNTFGQLGIAGPTTVSQGNSYNYNGTFNGSSTYSYSGSYYFTITGGVVTGTQNTTKTGTATGVIGSAAVSVTWTSTSGTLSLSCNLGYKIISISAISSLNPGTLSAFLTDHQLCHNSFTDYRYCCYWGCPIPGVFLSVAKFLR